MTVDLKHLTYPAISGLARDEGALFDRRWRIGDGGGTHSGSPKRLVEELFVKVPTRSCERRLGRVFIAPLDIVIRRDPLRTRQPDLMFISNARRYIIGRQVIEGGPDLVIEILSPSNTRRELEAKLRDYQSIGVREAWIVATQGQTVEVLQLSAGGIERSGLYGLGDHRLSGFARSAPHCGGDLSRVVANVAWLLQRIHAMATRSIRAYQSDS